MLLPGVYHLPGGCGVVPAATDLAPGVDTGAVPIGPDSVWISAFRIRERLRDRDERDRDPEWDCPGIRGENFGERKSEACRDDSVSGPSSSDDSSILGSGNAGNEVFSTAVERFAVGVGCDKTRDIRSLAPVVFPRMVQSSFDCGGSSNLLSSPSASQGGFPLSSISNSISACISNPSAS